MLLHIHTIPVAALLDTPQTSRLFTPQYPSHHCTAPMVAPSRNRTTTIAPPRNSLTTHRPTDTSLSRRSVAPRFVALKSRATSIEESRHERTKRSALAHHTKRTSAPHERSHRRVPRPPPLHTTPPPYPQSPAASNTCINPRELRASRYVQQHASSPAASNTCINPRELRASRHDNGPFLICAAPPC